MLSVQSFKASVHLYLRVHCQIDDKSSFLIAALYNLVNILLFEHFVSCTYASIHIYPTSSFKIDACLLSVLGLRLQIYSSGSLLISLDMSVVIFS